MKRDNKFRRVLILVVFVSISFRSMGQNTGEFSSLQFPAYLIDTAIVHKRGLEQRIKMLKNDCKWGKRIGGKIDVFWLRTEGGNFYGYVYEYFLDCDNLRLIYWYTNPSGQGTIVDFMIEDLEDESNFVIAKRKHLKNRKKV